MHRFVKVVDQINSKMGLISSYLIFLICFVLIYEIVGRYFFNSPTIWAHDISIYSFGIYSVFGCAYALHRNAHVAVDMVVKLFPKRIKTVIDIFGSLLFTIFLLILLRYIVDQMWTSIVRLEQSRSAFVIPVWPLKIVTTAGVFIFFLQSLAKLLRDIYLASTGREMA